MQFVKPAIAMGMIEASQPPDIMASACPYLIALKASPSALVEVAQAVTVGRFGPCALKRMATLPDAILDIIMGIKTGLPSDSFMKTFSASFTM